MKCPNCGAVMRYLSSGKMYFCEYCKYELPEEKEGPEPQFVKEIHHVYEFPNHVPHSTPVRKMRKGAKIAIVLSFLIPFLVIFFILRQIAPGVLVLIFLFILLIK